MFFRKCCCWTSNKLAETMNDKKNTCSKGLSIHSLSLSQHLRLTRYHEGWKPWEASGKGVGKVRERILNPLPLERDKAGQQQPSVRELLYHELEEFYNGRSKRHKGDRCRGHSQGEKIMFNFNPKASERMFGQVSRMVIARYASDSDLSLKHKVYDRYIDVDGVKVKECSKSPVVAFMEHQHVPKLSKLRF